jgi:hypothetical protein
VPAGLLVRQALLSRPAHAGGPGDPADTEWYPPGLLTVWLLGYGLAVFLVAMLLTAGTPGGLRGIIETALAEALALPGTPGGAEAAALGSRVAPVVPGLVIVSWFLMTAINAALAQGVLARFGRNLRPGMRLSQFELPGWAAAVLAVAALLAAVAPGAIGFAAANIAVVLGFGFVLSGLAVIHAMLRGRPARLLLLVAVYGTVLVFGWAVFLLAGLGVLDQWLGLRRRAVAGLDKEDT